MTVVLKDITASQWSMSLDVFGEIVTDVDDIKQCLHTILLTRQGTAPFWTDFGCGFYDYLDEPVNIVVPKMVRDVAAAIARWETRIVVQDISPELLVAGHLLLRIYWTTSELARKTFVTTFGAVDGSVTVSTT